MAPLAPVIRIFLPSREIFKRRSNREAEILKEAHIVRRLAAVGRQISADDQRVRPRQKRERLEVPQIDFAPAAQLQLRFRQDEPEHRDRLDHLKRIRRRGLLERRAGPWIEHVDRRALHVELRQRERQLNPLLAGFAESQDAAAADFEPLPPQLLERVQPVLIRVRGADVRKVGFGRLEVMIVAGHPGGLERLQLFVRHEPERAFRHETHLLLHAADRLAENRQILIRQPARRGDDAEPFGTEILGLMGPLDDPIRIHQRIGGDAGVVVAGLGAETTVLGALARLRIHERAQVHLAAGEFLTDPRGFGGKLENIRPGIELDEPPGLVKRDGAPLQHPLCNLFDLGGHDFLLGMIRAVPSFIGPARRIVNQIPMLG